MQDKSQFMKIVSLQEENIGLKKKLKELQLMENINEASYSKNDNSAFYEQKIHNSKKQFEAQKHMLQKEIQLTKQDFNQMEQAYYFEEQKNNTLKEHIRKLSSQNEKLEEELFHIREQYDSVAQRYQHREFEITEHYKTVFKKKQEQNDQILRKLREEIKQIDKKLNNQKNKNCLIEKQNQKLKQLIAIEMNKRKKKEYQYKVLVEKQQHQIRILNEEVKTLKKLVIQKDEKIAQREGKILSLELTMRDMNQRVKTIERSAKSSILRQKSNTKKAQDSLIMMKKYSENQLSKSRKKQKHYINNQKQLISRIKEAEGKVEDAYSTKSSRKNSMCSFKSVNTTLKQSPSVSNFVLQDEGQTSRLSINTRPSIDGKTIGIETPCFENTNQNRAKTLKLFKCRK